MAKHVVVLSHKGVRSKVDGLIPAHIVDVWDTDEWLQQVKAGNNPVIGYEQTFKGTTVSLRYYLMDYHIDDFPKYFKPTGRRIAVV